MSIKSRLRRWLGVEANHEAIDDLAIAFYDLKQDVQKQIRDLKTTSIDMTRRDVFVCVASRQQGKDVVRVYDKIRIDHLKQLEEILKSLNTDVDYLDKPYWFPDPFTNDIKRKK